MKILSDLNNNPRIIAAAIYNKNDKLFSSFLRSQDDTPNFVLPGKDGYFFEARQLHLPHTIYIEGETEHIGKVYIQASLASLYQQLKRNISITAIIVLLSLFCGKISSAKKPSWFYSSSHFSQ